MGGAGTSSPGSLKGLGWLQSECSADSLKGQSNKKEKKKINMQVSAFKIEKYSTYMGDAGTSSRGSLNGKVNDKKCGAGLVKMWMFVIITAGTIQQKHVANKANLHATQLSRVTKTALTWVRQAHVCRVN